MSMLSVKNLDEKALNYAVITVTPEAPLHCLVLTCLMVILVIYNMILSLLV